MRQPVKPPFGSKLLLPLSTDVQLHIRTTHRNGRYTAPPFTVPWCFMLVVLTVVGYMRQSVTLKLYGNFKRTGTAYPDDMLDIDGKRKKK